jgi:hypothetical protein
MAGRFDQKSLWMEDLPAMVIMRRSKVRRLKKIVVILSNLYMSDYRSGTIH